MRIVPDCMSNMFILPIAHSMNADERAREELAFIDKYAHLKGMLNRNEKFTRNRPKINKHFPK